MTKARFVARAPGRLDFRFPSDPPPNEVLKSARVRALRQGTTVNAILSDHLVRYAQMRDTQETAVKHLLELAKRSTEDDVRRAKRRGGRTWKREDLHRR